jgi:hypothetical protein
MNPVISHELPQLKSGFWKENTHNLSCMHDTETFQGPVFSYPIRYNNGIWYVRGFFCSLPCTKRYIIDNVSSFDSLSLFTLMCHKVYNCTEVIIPAPSRNILAKFFPWCGSLSIEEFRLKNKYDIITPPVFPFHQDIIHVARDAPMGQSPMEQSHMEQSHMEHETQEPKTEWNVLYPSKNLATLNNFFPQMLE